MRWMQRLHSCRRLKKGENNPQRGRGMLRSGDRASALSPPREQLCLLSPTRFDVRPRVPGTARGDLSPSPPPP